MKNCLQKKSLFIIWSACFVLLLGGCKNSGSVLKEEGEKEKISLKICISNVSMSQASLEELSEFYIRKHPEIGSIKWETVSDDSYYNFLKMNLASGKLPDIIMLNSRDALKMWSGHLAALNEAEAVSALDKRLLEGSQWNSNYYSLPVMYEEVGILYNMDILKSAGWNRIPATYSELRALCEDLKKHQKKAFINSYMNSYKMIKSGMVQMISMKKQPELYMQVLGKNNQSDIARDKDWEALMNFYDLTLSFGNRQPLQMSEDLARNYFSIGKYAMLVNENPDNMEYGDLSVETGPLLLSEEAENNKMQIKVIRLGVTDYCRNPEEAKKFLDWLAAGDGDFELREIQSERCLKWLADNKTTIGIGRTVPDMMVEKMSPIWTRYISHEISRDVFYQEISEGLQDYAKKYD